MVKLIHLTVLCLLWTLTRSLQFAFEVLMLRVEACAISNAELEVQVKIRRIIQHELAMRQLAKAEKLRELVEA